MWFESEWKVTVNKKWSKCDLKVKEKWQWMKSNNKWKMTVNEK